MFYYFYGLVKKDVNLSCRWLYLLANAAHGSVCSIMPALQLLSSLTPDRCSSMLRSLAREVYE